MSKWLKVFRKRKGYAITLIGVIALIWIIFFAMIYKRNSESSEVVAGNSMNALVKGDARVIHRYLYPEEISKNKLSVNDVQIILDEIILPGFERIGIEDPKIETNVVSPSQGLSEFQVPNFNVGETFNVVSQTIDGISYINLSPLIVRIYILEEMKESGESYSQKLLYRAMYKGFSRDKEILEKAGYTTLFEPDIYNGVFNEIDINEHIRRGKYWSTHDPAKKEIVIQPK